MRRAAGFFRDQEAIITATDRLTFGEAWERGLRTANFLLDRGLKPGDRVGVLEDNSTQASDFYLGATAANLVRVPLYPRNSRRTHAHTLERTGCRALVVNSAYIEQVDGLDAELLCLDHIIVRDRSFEDAVAAQAPVDPNPAVAPDDYYIIRSTGGTTGLPKGVAYTHRKWLAAGRDWFYNFPPVQVGDVTLHLGPISHGSGYFFLPTWMAGGKNVLVDHFDADKALELIEKERVTHMFVVPTMLNAMVRHPSARSRDLSSLKCLNVGGAPTSDDTARLGIEVFGDSLYQGYGQTEALPVIMSSPREWFHSAPQAGPYPAGRPLPWVEVEIRNPESHEPIGFGQEGEIAIRCDAQMEGYWGDSEATEQRMVDGWVLSGDIGRMDEQGYVYIVDRKDDMIISGGFNIWPAELENAILEHPQVVEAAVFAIPDAKWGETPVAICVVEPGAKATEEEVIELCRDRLGSYKKPSKVLFQLDPLPRSAVGKIQRSVLSAPYWAGHARRVGGG